MTFNFLFVFKSNVILRYVCIIFDLLKDNMDVKRDIIFYSNHCSFSRQILQIINEHHLKERFLVVCIDNPNLKLPPFVDRVPLAYTIQKKLYADENLLNYIKSYIQTSTLQPYALVGTNTSSYTDNYSFLSENDAELGDSSRNFNVLGFDQPIYAPKEEDGQRNHSLEKYMAERDADIQKILGKKPNTNGMTPF